MFNPLPPQASPGGTVTPEQWSGYIATLTRAYQASAGFERLKLSAEIDNARQARENALKLARLQAETSRYGVDQQRATAMAQLAENARQFEKQHALDERRFGLEERQFGLSEGELTGVYNGRPVESARRFDLEHGLNARIADVQEAQLLSSLRSEPDQMFQAMDVEQALASIRSGRPARQLATVPGTGVAAVDQAMQPGATAQARPSTDPRVKAMRAVVDALPPSETEGLDPAGVAALEAAFALYKAPLRPGTLETLSPTQQAGLRSAGRRLQGVTGRSYDDFISEYERNKPRQGSVRAA